LLTVIISAPRQTWAVLNGWTSSGGARPFGTVSGTPPAPPSGMIQTCRPLMAENATRSPVFRPSRTAGAAVAPNRRLLGVIELMNTTLERVGPRERLGDGAMVIASCQSRAGSLPPVWSAARA